MGVRRFLLVRLRHSPVLLRLFRFYADHAPIMLSLGLHLFVILLAVCDFSVWFSPEREKVVSVPVMSVDLKDIPVAAMTNLPPKLGMNKKKKTDAKAVKMSSYSRPAKRVAAKPVQQRSSAPSETSLVVQNKLNSMLNNVLKPKEVKTEKRPAEKQSAANDFQTLLASVDGMRGGAVPDEPEVAEEDIVTQGVDGGQGGSYAQELSVSERDLLGLKLRACWNIDAGVKGAQDMIVEIRAYLSAEGDVTDVKILNQARYRKDAAFRSVAESARRAVYICAAKQEESPFLMFPQRYGDAYESWKTLLLRFNPLDGEIQ